MVHVIHPATRSAHGDTRRRAVARRDTSSLRARLGLAGVCLGLGLPSCGGTVEAPKEPLPYGDDAAWVCLPGRPSDPCNADVTTTAIERDGTRRVERHQPAPAPPVDCFYVYPTVDLGILAGNHDDFRDTEKQRSTTLAQIGHFSEVCALWAPLYRQVTIGTYLRSKERLEAGLAIGFRDVEAAFREYLSRTPADRKVVLIGHSQGAEMTVRLLQRFFDGDETMRRRLLLAMPIGGSVQTAPGSTRGGSFANLPVCSAPGETGCVVAYRSYVAGEAARPSAAWLPPPGRVEACVNPASIDGGDGRFAHAYFPARGGVRRYLRGVDGVTTDDVDFPGFYAGRCVTQPNGFAYLEVSDVPQAGDVRTSVVDLRRASFGGMGLHLLDLQIEQGDLIAMIKRRVQ